MWYLIFVSSCLVAWVRVFLIFCFFWFYHWFFWFFFGFFLVFLVLLSVLFISLLLRVLCSIGSFVLPWVPLFLLFLFGSAFYVVQCIVFLVWWCSGLPWGFLFFCLRFCVCLGPALRALEQQGAYSGEPPLLLRPLHSMVHSVHCCAAKAAALASRP